MRSTSQRRRECQPSQGWELSKKPRDRTIKFFRVGTTNPLFRRTNYIPLRGATCERKSGSVRPASRSSPQRVSPANESQPSQGRLGAAGGHARNTAQSATSLVHGWSRLHCDLLKHQPAVLIHKKEERARSTLLVSSELKAYPFRQQGWFF